MAAKRKPSASSFRQAEEASKAKQKQSARRDASGSMGMGSTKKKPSNVKKVSKAIGSAAGAVNRTVISNPSNPNKASNLDKWLRGGKYHGEGKSITEAPSDIAHGINWAIRQVTPLPNIPRDRKTKKK